MGCGGVWKGGVWRGGVRKGREEKGKKIGNVLKNPQLFIQASKTMSSNFSPTFFKDPLFIALPFSLQLK
jgi:hypothetical protein